MLSFSAKVSSQPHGHQIVSIAVHDERICDNFSASDWMRCWLPLGENLAALQIIGSVAISISRAECAARKRHRRRAPIKGMPFASRGRAAIRSIFASPTQT